MLEATGYGSHGSPGGITRRDFLEVGALGVTGLSLSKRFALAREGRVAAGHDDRSAILIFNLGGPSHLDLFDMKPGAPREIRGPFRPVRTQSAEFDVSELLPHHARVANRFSLVRSCHHSAAAVHDTGHQLLQTGRLAAGGLPAPHVGCAVGYLRGARRDMPAHVILPEPMGATGGDLPHGQDAGFLGRAHDAFALMADPSHPRFRVPALASAGRPAAVRDSRGRRLRDAVEAAVRSFESSDPAARMDAEVEAAFRVLTSLKAREAFDLEQEPQAVRDRYGRNRFGQCCLLARRLVEAGVRFVTINTFLTVFNETTWDVHGARPFTSLGEMRDVVCPMYDRAYSALIEDLVERGLLETTLVACLGEFGRTPRINPAGGRDHWPHCWTVYFAGGGVQGGRAVGRSDAIGAFPSERPVEPAEVVATMYRSMGLPLDAELPVPGSRPLPLVEPGARALEELF